MASNSIWENIGAEGSKEVWNTGKDHFDSEDFEYRFMTLEGWKLEMKKIDPKEIFDIKPDFTLTKKNWSSS